MAYKTLYRVYRPQRFEDVAGQEHIITTLKHAVEENKIAHAYLFCGPRGTGKTSIAKLLAKAINCEHDITACGECENCKAIENNNHPDVIEIDAASNNGVDEVRNLIEKVKFAPSQGKYKVYIIDEVHMMSTGAFNALLKTLEEPPSHVIFILATTDPHKIPITILSRCQRFDLKKISEEKISNRLKEICKDEKIEISDDAINQIAHLGDGSLRDALSVLDQIISYKSNNINLEDIYEVSGIISQLAIYELVKEMLNNNITEVIKKINSYNDSGKSMVKITEDIIIYFRNLILFKTASEMVVNDFEIYDSISEKLSIQQIIDYINILNEALLDMKKFANTKMFLELAFIKMIDLNNLGNAKIVLKEDKMNAKDFPGNVIESKFEKGSNIKKIKIDEKKEINKTELKANGIKQNDNDTSKLNKFIDRRVSNTLANFSKKQTAELKQNLDKLNDYIMDEKYGEIASMILDGQLKAVGNEYIIFTYKTINLVNLFIENITNVENLLRELLELNCKVIAVDTDKWDEIKEKFNSKAIQYVFEEEQENIEDILKELNQNDNDNIQSLFGNLVEYK